MEGRGGRLQGRNAIKIIGCENFDLFFFLTDEGVGAEFYLKL